MKRVIVLLLCAGTVATTNATVSRILSMGKSDNFFMDETSIYRNPANVNVYPNMLMGATGEYRVLPQDTALYVTDSAGNQIANYAALRQSNRDPRDGFFGGIVTYSFKESDEQAGQVPMLSFGAVFNRRDKMLSTLPSGTYRVVSGDTTTTWEFAEPIGKVDLLAGYALKNGLKLGLGGYAAFQKYGGVDTALQSTFARVTAGANWPINRSMDMEVSGGVSWSNSVGAKTVVVNRAGVLDTIGGPDLDTVADNDLTVDGDFRLFSAMTVLNGDFVPHAGIRWMQRSRSNAYGLDINLGVGLNVNIDKGFFWAGLEGLFKQYSVDGATSSTNPSDTAKDMTGVGGRVSFGIERNVVWDWFVVRVGVTKTIMYVTRDNNVTYWTQNPEHDADDDLIGFGIGLNVENRLKFDILVAEDVVHTLTNLFSGSEHHVFTRIDATYSF
jgi:hypothetical protein